MGVTTTYGWRSPNLGDIADGPAGILTGLQDAENTIKDTTILTYTPGWASEGSVQPSGAGSRTGHYRVDNGVCHLAVRLTGAAGVNGGTGNLYLMAPLPPNPSIARQILPCYFVANIAGGGIYLGFANLLGGVDSRLRIYLPASASETRFDAWRNATEGNSPGTGIPLVPGGWGMHNGSELVISGSYFL